MKIYFKITPVSSKTDENTGQDTNFNKQTQLPCNQLFTSVLRKDIHNVEITILESSHMEHSIK